MKRAIFAALVALTLALPAVASAQKEAYKRLGTKMTAVTLDTATTTMTFNAEATTGYGLLVLEFSLTDANSSATVHMTCKGGSDPSDINYVLQSCPVTAGVATCVDASFDKANSGTSKWPFRVDIEGFPNVACVVTDTGGLVADVLTVKASVATKGG